MKMLCHIIPKPVTIVYMYCVFILNTIYIQDTGYMNNALKGLCLPIYRASIVQCRNDAISIKLTSVVDSIFLLKK